MGRHRCGYFDGFINDTASGKSSEGKESDTGFRNNVTRFVIRGKSLGLVWGNKKRLADHHYKLFFISGK